MDDELDPVAAVAALNLPLRRRVYDHVSAHADGVNRDQTADALGVSRSVAAFNLDRLAEVGLVEVDYRRPEGRSGPGAGRPAKWYRRADTDVSVSVPGRHYDVAALILAEAVERSQRSGTSVQDSIRDAAREQGAQLGAAVTAADDGRRATQLVEVLARHGYEPERCDDLLAMANCPFHALVDQHRELVCTLNHALLCGLAERAGLPHDAAKLDPSPTRCCVTLTLPRPA